MGREFFFAQSIVDLNIPMHILQEYAIIISGNIMCEGADERSYDL
jgi:hypothetical protein